MSINRWQLILNKLLITTDLSLKDLCTKTELSKHIVKSSIEMINDNLSSILKIEMNKNGNYFLSIFDSSVFSEIIGVKLKSSVDFTSASKRKAYFILRLTTDTYVTIDDLADETKVSVGTLKSDLKNMTSLLEKYNLVVKGIPNKGYIIVGSESDKRSLLINYAHDFFPNEFLPPKKITDYFKEKILNQNELDVNNSLLRKCMVVSYFRLKKGFFITNPVNYFENIHQDTTHMDEFFYFIEQDLKITLNDAEKKFMKYPLHLANQKGFSLKESAEQTLENIFNKMMDAIRSEYIIEIEKEGFFLDIRNHLITLVNRMLFYYKPFDIFSNSLSKTYPLPYRISAEAIKELGKTINRSINEVEINFFTVYFEIFLQQKFQHYKKKIAIVSDSGLSVNKLIEQQLIQILGKDIEITYFSEALANTTELDDYSLIFSNVPIKNNRNNLKIIRISNIFNRSSFTLDSLYDVGLTRLVEENIFFKRNNPNNDYKSNLLSMIEDLKKEDLVDDHFTERICKSINRSSFYKNNIAFPHVVNKKNKGIIIYVSTNGGSNNNESDFIETIILLAIPDKLDAETEAELVRLYDFIFKIIGDFEMMERIKQIDNKDAFLELLSKGENSI